MEHVIIPDPLKPVVKGARKPRPMTLYQWYRQFDRLREYMGDRDAFEVIAERIRIEAKR